MSCGFRGGGAEGFNYNVEMSEYFRSAEGTAKLGKFCRVIIIISFGIYLHIPHAPDEMWM